MLWTADVTYVAWIIAFTCLTFVLVVHEPVWTVNVTENFRTLNICKVNDKRQPRHVATTVQIQYNISMRVLYVTILMHSLIRSFVLLWRTAVLYRIALMLMPLNDLEGHQLSESFVDRILRKISHYQLEYIFTYQSKSVRGLQ